VVERICRKSDRVLLGPSADSNHAISVMCKHINPDGRGKRGTAKTLIKAKMDPVDTTRKKTATNVTAGACQRDYAQGCIQPYAGVRRAEAFRNEASL
jgi:hypothetical protein